MWLVAVITMGAYGWSIFPVPLWVWVVSYFPMGVGVGGIVFSYGCLWVWVAMGVGDMYFVSAMGAGGVGGIVSLTIHTPPIPPIYVPASHYN